MAALRVLMVACALAATQAVDRSKFRGCADAGFCKRHRDKTVEPEFRVEAATVAVDAKSGLLTATVRNDVAGSPPFELRIAFYESGVVRMRITEKDDKPPRWESPDVILESGTKPTSIKVKEPADADVVRITGVPAGKTSSATHTHIQFTIPKSGKIAVLALQHKPLKADLYIENFGSGPIEPAISVNERSLVYFEHRRVKGDSSLVAQDTALAAAGAVEHAGRKILDWGEDGKPIYEDGSHGDDGPHDAAKGAGSAADVAGRDVLSAASADVEPGMWEEKFGTHHDSKPHGPTSVGLDVTFPTATHVYGIPEHASTHALRATDGSEGGAEYKQPYRLYNLDVFEYELDNPMALYGSIPFMIAHSPAGHSVGVFWNNPTETYVDITKGVRSSGSSIFAALTGGGGPKVGVATRWISESGVFDLSLVPGPSPKDVVTQYTSLTGTQELPPLFALGYHQCRWNYKDEADVFGIDAKFEEYAFPYDVIWLDIEHTDGKRYFTWDSHLFPNPAAMQEKLAARGHKMVTIIDPHIKRDSNYRIHSDASSKGLYTQNAQGAEYDGWCWPGSSSYLDFTSPKVRDWWAEQFAFTNYAGSTPSLYTWNDMNEPSVFNGPEVSMNKDAKNLQGVEHREWHNMYGFYQQMATQDGLIKRNAGQNVRPFVLSRAFYAGSQRFGAIWTGDNEAKWEHLAIASKMLLTIGAAGLTFSGADVGGFFNNPSTELMTRWYQAGAFQPFFRAHAHIDTARREPWLFGDEVLSNLRDIVRTRYHFLPFWYTLFAEAAATGVPTMRPLWMEYPKDSNAYGIDDQWLVGSDLLVKPVTTASATSVDVYFPDTEAWYDIITFEKLSGPGRKTVAAPLTKIPVYQRAGSVIPKQMRARRASSLMAQDPYTLIIALDSRKSATGQLYLDDGNTFDYRNSNSYRLRKFDFDPASDSTDELKSSGIRGGKSYAPSNTVERIVILGAGRAPVSITASDAGAAPRSIEFTYDASLDVITLRKPDVKIAYDWTVQLQYKRA